MALLLSKIRLLSGPLMRWIEFGVPLSNGIPPTDDRCIVNCIIFAIVKAQRWRDAPASDRPIIKIRKRLTR